jgi:hypothetical protein
MGIDHVIDYPCIPKETFATLGIMTRLKARDRAATIIKLYRDNGDMRPPSEMGFEMARRLPDGSEESQTVIVQDLLNEANQLDSVAHHCEGCPANRTKRPFGCFGYINYPISQAAELWLLKQLPSENDPLVFLLLSQTMREFKFDNETLAAMRQSLGVFFESNKRYGKTLEDAMIDNNQVFEMLFMTERIDPAHGVLLMLFFGAIPRDSDAQTLIDMTREAAQNVPFLHKLSDEDDTTVGNLKEFFETLWTAYRLGVPVSLDV